MQIFAYCVYDEKVQTFGTPFFKPNAASAIRDFSDLAVDRQTMIGRHPEDYTLYQIGVFDDQDALFNPTQPPLNLGKATQFIDI